MRLHCLKSDSSCCIVPPLMLLRFIGRRFDPGRRRAFVPVLMIVFSSGGVVCSRLTNFFGIDLFGNDTNDCVFCFPFLLSLLLEGKVSG